MLGGIRPISSRTRSRLGGALVAALSVAAAAVRADLPAQLLGYVQSGPLRTTVATLLTEREADAFMLSMRPSLDLWKDRGVPPPLQNSRLAFVPTGDLGGLLSRLVDTTTPYLRSGRAERVSRLLSALNTSRCLRGWWITREYVGPLDVHLALSERADGEWEIHASLAPSADPNGRADRASVKGLSLAFPTGVRAAAIGATPR
jgi:hypothetical protein